MAATPDTPNNGRSTLEFALVLVMLGILTILVAFILFPKIDIPRDQTAMADYLKEKEMIYNYRKDLLSIIIAAFGAWVGAGAAYFFGRENLRESANSLLRLHKQMTGAEKLETIKVRDIPPKLLNANFQETQTIQEVTDKLTANPAMWFIPVKSGDKWHVINNEAIYIYINKKLETLSGDAAYAGKPYADIKDAVMKTTLKDATDELEKDDLTSKFVNKYIIVKADDSAAKVNKEMDDKSLFLAIVTDASGEFVQYFTTSDIRKALVAI